ncbi:TMV resistance protein N-like [Prunus avium]|uniref:ADP-ribosyl cyclase/cyclic ADP-ribose hydrolase n=1 Tax=Prunus avium TaxID=42229 RepID=A0A6P5RAU6_PRUAV|nr:TMV resistance protein N-like [Prunus avium]
MNSSSPPPPFAAPLQTRHDVFLSFRGEDTRDGFTSHLHAALLRNKIETYMDRRLEKGDEIEPALLEAIEKSKIALVIFSEDYASSTWCLKELVHILGCQKSHGQIVIPIFYRIDPSDVRKHQGTYALEDSPLKRSKDEVANWRAALEEAANISGFHDSRKTGTEADFVEEVVQDVLTKLNRESSSDLKGLVGIKSRIQQIESLLCLDSPGVCCVGIWGMGGIGKTTLADAVFHRQSSKFDAACFLANVREKSEQTGGLNQLRNELVREILKDRDINIGTLSIGSTSIRDRLSRTKVLIVLDDVNAREQLEVLVGDHDGFCQGSRIIITARDTGLLGQTVDPAKIYNVEGLGSDEALHLFHSRAFRNKSPTTDYAGLSREVVRYSKGNPLALKVMGSLFHRCKSKKEWEAQWNKLKRFPSEEINKVLRLSYDGLEENEKEMFLDIACFYKGYLRKRVERMLDCCDFFGEAGINDLIDRSLISISKEGRSEGEIEMHDLVQEMGRAIARKQGSRLFNDEDVYQALTNNQRDGDVQAISFDLSNSEKLHLELEHANFEKMYQLKWLRVRSSHNSRIGSLDLPNSLGYLNWFPYPLKSLPSKFSAQNLVYLEIVNSEVEGQLWNEDQSPVNLKRIRLAYSNYLTEVPNLSRSLKIEHIDLDGCQSLVEIPSYFQHLGKLTYLNLEQCINLKNLPEMPCNLEFLNLSNTAIEELPSSVWFHEKISHLDIGSCRDLKSLPASIKQAAQLSRLCLSWCTKLESLPELPPLLQCLEAHGCISLKTVSSSSTAITQGWEEYIFSRRLHEKHIFYHCPKLDENARSNIMGDAQLRIMRMAIASSKFKEDKIEEAYDSYYADQSNQYKEFFGKRSFVAIRCWGYEIPNWFSHKSEGCSIKIELPRDWFSTDFLGFALSLVAVTTHYYTEVGCKYNFKTSNGESHEVNHPFCNPLTKGGRRDSHDVFVWWYNNVFEEVEKGAESPTAFYKLVTEVKVDFTVRSRNGFMEEEEEVEVKKCGICVLYGKDAEMIKQRALYAQDF